MGRPKLERVVLQARVNPDTPDKLKQIALELGFQWGADGNTGKLHFADRRNFDKRN